MGSWKKVADGIWVRVYQFNDNLLNTSAVARPDGGMLVVSPGTDLGDGDFAELNALGTVRALLAPGAFHNMGLPAWLPLPTPTLSKRPSRSSPCALVGRVL